MKSEGLRRLRWVLCTLLAIPGLLWALLGLTELERSGGQTFTIGVALAVGGFGLGWGVWGTVGWVISGFLAPEQEGTDSQSRKRRYCTECGTPIRMQWWSWGDLPNQCRACLKPEAHSPWGSITLESAKKATLRGAYTAYAIAGFNLVAVLSGYFVRGSGWIGTFQNPLNLFDVVVFGALGFGVGRGSRAAAVGLVTMFVLERLLIWMELRRFPGWLALVLFYFLARAVQGSFRLNSFRTEPQEIRSSTPSAGMEASE